MSATSTDVQAHSPGRGWVSPTDVVLLFVLGMVFVCVVAGGTWFDLHSTSECPLKTLPSGANIDLAWKLALFAALGGLALIGFVGKEQRLLIALFLFEAATLGIAIGLVALDSGTYHAIHGHCGYLGSQTFTEVHHVSAVEFLWGLPLAGLLLLAGSCLTATAKAKRVA